MAGKKRHSSRKATVTQLTETRPRAGKGIGLFVLGMHRSGTSAVTRVLNLLGADLGEKLMQAQPGVNDTGFWEHLEVVALHERLLRWRQSSWFDCRPIPPVHRTALIQQTAAAEAAEIIREDFRDSELWAIKDPRMCLFVPVWMQAASALTSRLGIVIFIRNPDEVAASLARRDGITSGHAYLLWGKHLVESVRGSVGQPRAVGVYSRLLDDWRKEMDSIARSLSLEWPVPADRAGDEIDRFLDVTRRHHSATPNTNESTDPLHQVVNEMYRAMLAIADGNAEWSAIDTLFVRFDDLAAATAPQIHNLLDHVMSHSNRADKAEQALARFVAELDGSGATEEREHARQDAVLVQLEQLKLNSVGAIEAIASVSQGQSQIMEELPIRLSDIREALDRGSRAQELEFARLAELADTRQEKIDALLRRVEELTAEASGFHAREAEFAAAGLDREAKVESLRNLVASRDQQLTVLATRLDEDAASWLAAEQQLRNELQDLNNRWRSEVAVRGQREADIVALNNAVERMVQESRALSDNLAEASEIIAQLKLEREQLIVSLAERDFELAERGRELAERDLKLYEHDNEIVSLLAAISAAEAEAVKQARHAAARDAEILQLSMQSQAIEARLHHCQEVVARRDGEIERMLASKSWKATTPLRWIAGIFRKQIDV